MMKFALACVLSAIYYPLLGLCLVLFQPIQWLALKLGGYRAHKLSVDYLNLSLLACLRVLGTRIRFDNPYPLPSDAPLIVVANHQSMYDIPPLSWFFRAHHPKFVAKQELGRYIPSVSFNLRHGGSVLIDRQDPRQSLRAITSFGKSLENSRHCAVIFPEGTRGRNGKAQSFTENGLKMLTRNAPSAYVVPVTINNAWQLQQYGIFPLGIGVHLSLQVHQPIPASSVSFRELFESVEATISGSIR